MTSNKQILGLGLLLLILVTASLPAFARELVADMSPTTTGQVEATSQIFLLRENEDWDVFRLEIEVRATSRSSYLDLQATDTHRATVTLPSHFKILEKKVSHKGEPLGQIEAGVSEGIRTRFRRSSSDGRTQLNWNSFFPRDAHPDIATLLTYTVDFSITKGDTYGDPPIQIDTIAQLALIDVVVSAMEGAAVGDSGIKSGIGAGSAEAKSKGITLTMAYGTNRAIRPRPRPGSEARYGNKPSTQLEFGTVDVTLPSYASRKAWEDSKDERVFRVDDYVVGRESARAFFAREMRKKNRVFVFVHGYNVSFEQAAMSTARLALDAGLGSEFAPAFFSWPSNGEFALTTTDDRELKLAYLDDEKKAESKETSAAFKEFLSLVNRSAKGKKLTIVFHSMGHRLLVNNVEYLKELNLENVVSVAGDCDREKFHTQIKKLKHDGTNQMAAPVTVYASLDLPLKLSEMLHNSRPRLGQGGPEKVRAFGNGDTVDAAEFVIPLRELGHSTVFRKSKPLNDLKLLLFRGRDIANISTREKAKDNAGLRYWKLRKNPKPNYIRRLLNAR